MNTQQMLSSTVWWHVFPLGACGAPVRDFDPASAPVARLPRLEPWLDYIIQLGANGLLLGPVFASVSHGYDTLDHFRLDPRLGTNADLERLVALANQKGIHVMLDGVFNHVSREHPRVEELGLRNADGTLHSWEGHGELITLDHSKPEVRELVVEAMKFWLQRGIAGWRLDVAYAVPTDFWREVLGEVRSAYPDVLFLGEVIHGDYADFVEQSTVDTLTQYELWKSIQSSIQSANFWELDWNLQRHAQFVEHFVPNTFIGNHDVTRIANELGEEGAILAAAILLTLPGMPSIYYGDEQGFRGEKLSGFSSDDQLRPPLPPAPENLSELGKHIENIYRGLIGVRRQHPWIANGILEVLDKDNPRITYRVAERASRSAISVAVEVEPFYRVTVTDETTGAVLFGWKGTQPRGGAIDGEAQNTGN
ncbi:alpha-amylase family protein [Actinobaculum massiliense]|uniref:Glycosyl hydrolase family 13 catalytic domain-containing protein n=1 Tax=Actinobaculum massiliense ACS-171-V-Col2 TaxID=883066 RepID=K9EEM9_9ACTO|nr:alpha-amylase family protein [Actinobaculum massiliense]EKU95694.1 hypothetical protein HMPREF9233_00481 [Actinobaculum massiliense ACS-171-V-Col2]MDK8319443.1 alpha-amylase family protein [Actinobaculum massiliense]MDK8566590.1 alpha-amylase family protein [Actinobaculum massiliense]